MPHPLSLFKYCPICGSHQFVENNEKSKRCSDCHFVYYFNPSAAAVAVIENDKGEILVARRAKEPAKGTLDLPGGFADLHETIEESLLREVKEETNLDVETFEFLFSIPNLYIYSGLEVHTMDMFFRCKVSNTNTLKAQDDVEDLFFIDIKNLNPSEFGMLSVRKGIEMIVKKRIVIDKK